MITMILAAIIILSLYYWATWSPEQEAVYQRLVATQLQREKQARHERWEIGVSSTSGKCYAGQPTYHRGQPTQKGSEIYSRTIQEARITC